ncbi:MAG: mechanosensitive ion channel [Spirochaetota bacterium]|nr:mechanosensitive ion channel [Spirochaetota bacterium]
MDYKFIITKVETLLGDYSYFSDYLIFIGILLASYLSYIIIGRYLLYFVERLIRRSKIKIDDFIIDSDTLKRLSYIVPVLVLYNLAVFVPSSKEIIEIICNIIIIFIILISISAFLNAVNNFYETKPISKLRPIKGYIQVANIIIYIVGLVFIIGILTGKSPLAIMGGIGALTAILILVFRDTILSFVSSIQISSYDLVRKGDWIEMPNYGVDGEVIDIELHTIKVQNWDKTINVIPTNKLTDESFKNWRGMTQSGGRRIKRAINIDVNSIKFCDDEMIERFSEIRLISDYIKSQKDELDKYNNENNINSKQPLNILQMTNIGIFKQYVEAYLMNHPKINHNMTCMVRQLRPGSTGLPIEIYAFTNDVIWLNYEAIQSKLFDHILAAVSHFDLRIYQSPSGRDIREVDFTGPSSNL